MWVSDIRHFLTEAGEIPPDLPSPAGRLLNRFSKIVADVTSCVMPDETKGTMLSVDCVKRPRGKACPARLYGGYLAGSELSIWWECPLGCDAGIITGWENTQWDHRREQSELAARGWNRRAYNGEIRIPVSSLKEVTVFRPNDLYDFARLGIELRRISESRRIHRCVSSQDVYSLISDFASFIDPTQRDRDVITKALAQANYPLNAFIVDDKDDLSGNHSFMPSIIRTT